MRRVDADQFLTSVEHKKLTGEYVDPAAGRITLKSYAEEWRAIQVHRPSTSVQLEANLRNHVYPSLGHRPIGSIRPTEVQAWVKAMIADDLAPSTVELIYRYLVSVYRAAVEDRIISASPCRGIKLPKLDHPQVEPLETAQVSALVEAMPERYPALIILGAGTGLRQGEAFGLAVDRVDFLRRVVTVDRQLLLVRGAPTLGPPKTAASTGRCHCLTWSSTCCPAT